MDTINDELLARYVDGVATPDEQILVRDYLAQNPEEYESILYMMDLDREDYLGEMIEDNSNNIVSLNDSVGTNITLSAAAFVPQNICALTPPICKVPAKRTTKKSFRKTGLQDRLSEMLQNLQSKNSTIKT